MTRHKALGRHLQNQRCGDRAGMGGDGRKSLSGLCRENSYSEVIAANPVVQGVTSKNFGIT
nr:MAG TPA: hypothetical protein [Caudoviricetes sp.]